MSNFSYSKNYEGIIQVFMRRGEYYGPLLGFLENVMIEESKLSKIEREVIAAYVSRINGCSFCVEAHRATIRALGGSDALTVSIEESRENIQDISEKMRLLLGFAEKITHDPHGINEDKDIEPLRKANIDEETIEDAANVAGLFNFINRLVDTFGVKGSEKHFNIVGNSLAKNGYVANK